MLLSIKLEGKAIGTARIGVSQLMKLLENLEKAFLRAGQVIQGQGDSARRGPKGLSIKKAIELDLTDLTHGSPATVLGFERRSEPSLPGFDLGMEIFEKSLEGLTSIQQPNDSIPSGFDAGVLLAWRDMGMLFDKGCDKITFTLNHRDTPLVSEYTPRGLQSIQARIKGPQLNVRTVEGRLLMADFKEYGARCRVHPSVGDPILCLFDEDKKEEILDSILHYVRVVGEAKEDPNTNKITAIRIQGIQILEGKENEQTDILPQGSPLPSDFWSSPTLEELAEAQGVHPIKDISVLFGTWPGDADDGFEEMITAMREQSVPERDK